MKENCRSKRESDAALPTCPICGRTGRKVGLHTVEALLDERALPRLQPKSSYHFCGSFDCRAVYYGNGEREIFSRGDLRVPAYEKEPAGSRTICYCFSETETDIRREIELTGKSQATQRVRAAIAECGCTCEVRNPSGTCCLRQLAEAVERAGHEARPKQ